MKATTIQLPSKGSGALRKIADMLEEMEQRSGQIEYERGVELAVLMERVLTWLSRQHQLLSASVGPIGVVPQRGPVATAAEEEAAREAQRRLEAQQQRLTRHQGSAPPAADLGPVMELKTVSDNN